MTWDFELSFEFLQRQKWRTQLQPGMIGRKPIWYVDNCFVIQVAQQNPRHLCSWEARTIISACCAADSARSVFAVRFKNQFFTIFFNDSGFEPKQHHGLLVPLTLSDQPHLHHNCIYFHAHSSVIYTSSTGMTFACLPIALASWFSFQQSGR